MKAFIFTILLFVIFSFTANSQKNYQKDNDSDIFYPSTGKTEIGTTNPQARLDIGNTAPNETKAILARLSEGKNSWLSVNSYDSQPIYCKMFAIEHRFYDSINSSINFYRGGAVKGGYITFDIYGGRRIAKLSDRGLDVYGIITGKGIIINEIALADFVFNDNYCLKPLAEVSEYIKTNKRLPDIPSEQEAKENGVNIGEMQAKLLQKVEELTLYLIQQQELIDKLNSRIEKLERK